MVEAAHAVWSAPAERRRMRAFGFRPAVEPGVLKREWHGLRVRVSAASLVAARPELGELRYDPLAQRVTSDGQPFSATAEARALVSDLTELIGAYERWVEAREGRRERIERARAAFPDRRPINALAETRRVQRLLQSSAWGRRR